MFFRTESDKERRYEALKKAELNFNKIQFSNIIYST